MTYARLILIVISIVTISSCFHLHISKIPRKYITAIKNDITSISSVIFVTYNSNTKISVDSIKNTELKRELRALNVDYITITYKFDSSVLTHDQPAYFNRRVSDSCIEFVHSKDAHNFTFDTWSTTNIVYYYFGVKKPSIKNSKDEFSDLTKKVNDSLYFERIHYPPIR